MGTIVNRGEIWNFRFDRPDKQRLFMKTVSIAVDEELLEQIDAVAQVRRQKRSEILCEAARQWLKQQRIKTLVKKDRSGYRKQPVEPDEFGPLIRAQKWGRL